MTPMNPGNTIRQPEQADFRRGKAREQGKRERPGVCIRKYRGMP